MPQPDHPARRGPKGRSDTTRPASTPHSTRRSTDRRPYPTAPTRTRPSPPGAHPNPARTASHHLATAPTPATVWASGPTPIDPHATWPTPILTTIITSFSQPGAHVALLPWPTTHRPTVDPTASGQVIDHPTDTNPDDELAATLTTIHNLNRTARVVRIQPHLTPRGRPSRRISPDLVETLDHCPTVVADPPLTRTGTEVPTRVDAAPADTNLIITSLHPQHHGDHTSDHVALLAARLLRIGGILAILTHCDWSHGDLIDPTGPLVTSGQNADLLYLQHIIALHTPIHDHKLAPDLDNSTAGEGTQLQHRPLVPGRPAPHRRIHSDILVFAQPHDHQPPSLGPTDRPVGTGVTS